MSQNPFSHSIVSGRSPRQKQAASAGVRSRDEAAVKPVVPASPAAPAPASPVAAPAAAAAPVTAQSPTGASPSAPAQQPTAAAAAPEFSLPDLGPGPNEADPQYADAAGKEKYARDLADYQHKQFIHDQFTQLASIMGELHPGRDFKGEYESDLAAMNQHQKDRPQESGLLRGMLTIGGFNPADQGASLANYDKNVAEQQKASDSSFSQRMALRTKMHEAKAAELEAKGNWKGALAEREKLALIEADQKAQQSERDLEKQKLIIEGQNKRAQMKGDAMRDVAIAHNKRVGAALPAGIRAAFEKKAGEALAQFFGPESFNKSYDTSVLEEYAQRVNDILDRLEHPEEHKNDKPNNTPAPTSDGPPQW